ncbi:MAG: 2-succinyl-5-enolpyruvyl-6-hydroxy-3-cyclohexene-1-carboxylic-acid synthase [Muribaculaceae bacterium]|nr:2-succinyl-5-enolpyruvyl-6-hydroxy-3-cyclohexene-1-carboxylic-acid synthase [Muribaculaceae bacterium]
MSYSDKDNINILCAVMLGHGITHAVVCPGSRNAPIVHNLNECPQVKCYPVTDERSAGFFALGMAEQLREPVAVVVTSGTAVLNLAPAVAEAWYRHLPLVVISADRPMAHIGQQMGQTIDQPDVLSRFTLMDVNLVEPHDDLTRWQCNRLANEALLASRRGGPVHINVPYDEPLFNFTVPSLSMERIITSLPIFADEMALFEVLKPVKMAQKPMLVIGQLDRGVVTHEIMNHLVPHMAVLVESLGSDVGGNAFDELLPLVEQNPDFAPDFVIYMGGTLVSKRIKAYLRRLTEVPMIQIDEHGEIHDTFGNLTQIIHCAPQAALHALEKLFGIAKGNPFARLWCEHLDQIAWHFDYLRPDFSQMLAVKLALQSASELNEPVVLHFANSQPVRLANLFARQHVRCNRGVNGIEGSTSTAAGCAAVTDERVLCVTGDLSFFYDQNALWNSNLRGNLRILLLNNGGGGIFAQLPGLEASPARDTMIAASHRTHARGCCEQHGVEYRVAYGSEDLYSGITWLVQDDSARPRLLEVVTDGANDRRVWQQATSSLTTDN